MNAEYNEGRGPTWPDILDQWATVELDFQDYGIDLVAVMDERTWTWFQRRVMRRIAAGQATPIGRLFGPQLYAHDDGPEEDDQ